MEALTWILTLVSVQVEVSGSCENAQDLASFCLETAKTRVVTAYPAASGDGFLLSIA